MGNGDTEAADDARGIPSRPAARPEERLVDDRLGTGHTPNQVARMSDRPGSEASWSRPEAPPAELDRFFASMLSWNPLKLSDLSTSQLIERATELDREVSSGIRAGGGSLGPRERAAKAEVLIKIFGVVEERINEAPLNPQGLPEVEGITWDPSSPVLSGSIADISPFDNIDLWVIVAGSTPAEEPERLKRKRPAPPPPSPKPDPEVRDAIVLTPEWKGRQIGTKRREILSRLAPPRIPGSFGSGEAGAAARSRVLNNARGYVETWKWFTGTSAVGPFLESEELESTEVERIKDGIRTHIVGGGPSPSNPEFIPGMERALAEIGKLATNPLWLRRGVLRDVRRRLLNPLERGLKKFEKRLMEAD